MKKIFYLIIALHVVAIYNAQVGINTTTPNSSLEVLKISSLPTAAKDGIMPPSLTKLELAQKGSGVYGTSQKSALIYVSDASGTVTGLTSASQVVNITEEGYYYFDGTVWRKLVTSNVALDNTNDAWINETGKVELATKANGNARDAKTDVSVHDNGRLGIGIGTESPDAGIHLRGDGDGWKDDIRLDSYSGNSTDTPAANFRFNGSRGTATTPVNLTSGNTIGQINFHGKVGSSSTNFPSLARIWSSYEGDGTTEKASLNFSSSGAQNKSLVINADGNVGIGTSSPTNKLEISNTGGSDTGLKLPQGASAGLKLTSDANGNAYWNNENVKFGNVPTSGRNIPTFATQYYTGASITLKKGKWEVDFGTYIGLATYNSSSGTFTTTSGSTGASNSVINTDSTIWCTCTLSSTQPSYTGLAVGNNGLISGSGIAGANNMSRGARSMQVQGKILLNVTDDERTYYMFVLCNNFGASVGDYRPSNVFGDGWERWFYATPL